MKNEPEIVKILREEEKLGKLQCYISHKNNKLQTFDTESYTDISPRFNDRKISYHIMSSKKNLFTTYKMMLSDKIFEGENIRKFEESFKKYLGAKHAISTSSGRMALYLILKSLDIKEGDEILIPAYMLPLIPQVSIYCGLKPVFVDIDPCTFNINPNEIEKKITKNTKIILVVHIFGRPCDMEKIEKIAKKYDLIVIEDCAQAIGAEYKGKKVGTLSNISYFSFGCAKDLSTFGGGMIITNDDIIYERIRETAKNLSWPEKDVLIKRILNTSADWFFGTNFIFDYVTYPLFRLTYLFDKNFVFNKLKSEGVLKLQNLSEKKFLEEYGFLYTNLQATIGLEQLNSLDKNIMIKVTNAEILDKNLKIPALINKDIKCTYYRYCIKTDDPEKLLVKLFKSGIVITDGSYLVLPDLEMFKDYKCDCPNARLVSKQLIYLPVQPHLNKEDMMKLVNVLNKYLYKAEKKEDIFLLKETIKHRLFISD